LKTIFQEYIPKASGKNPIFFYTNSTNDKLFANKLKHLTKEGSRFRKLVKKQLIIFSHLD
jgi:hypothetical protein